MMMLVHDIDIDIDDSRPSANECATYYDYVLPTLCVHGAECV